MNVHPGAAPAERRFVILSAGSSVRIAGRAAYDTTRHAEGIPIDLTDHARGLAYKSTVLYVLGHVLDLITTYVLSPGLERETNVMVDVYNFGWSYILAMAVATSVIMLAALRWVWRRLVERFPSGCCAYGGFYKSVLYGANGRRDGNGAGFATGALIGIVCIAAYAAIATKLFTGVWNLSVLAFGVTTHHFFLLLVTKVGVASLVGLAMFFLYPYWLHRSHRGA